ncbi:MAG TPA: DUF2207 domain-containing protein, partial [Sphingomicrobium sp.]|nr:DUF2207 domain-containing protein [Sphingomicrobium sp.]
MRLWRSILAAAIALLAAAHPALAEERITRFTSDVEIRPDASLDVSETIDVIAEHNRINRGIFRDFPTRYRGRNGAEMHVGFDLISVTRNGSPEPAKLEAVSRGVRIRIGDPDRLIEQAEHRYVIRYRTTRQIGRFPDHDELYWNATGNGWAFPIDRAEAYIRLPGAAFGDYSLYTGPQGSKASDAELVEKKPGEIAFRTTRPLAPGEGLTVAVAFPKGVIAEPGSGERASYWLSDYGPLAVGGLGLIGICIFYYFAWARAGRDPRPGTVVPLFSPPDGLSPAAMRYIWKRNVDNRAFAAAVVDAGVKGHVRLSEEDGGFFGLAADKMRLERLAGTDPLPDAEGSMLTQLAMTGETIVMEQKNHEKFAAAKKMLDSAFKKDFEGRMFNRNYGWAAAGIAFTIAALWLTAAAVTAATGTVDKLQIGVAIGALLTCALLASLAHGLSTAGKCLVVALMFVAFAGALATGMPILFAAFRSGWVAPLALPLLAIPLMISSFFWIAAPTREGRAVLDRIMGFRQYLSIAEGPRLDRMTGAPTPTVELFEKYLPFAIALGVENAWADRFKDILAAAQAQGNQGFGWYSGSSNPWDSPGNFVSTIGSGLASTLSSASTAPGSSSGVGGGGSSGGGG